MGTGTWEVEPATARLPSALGFWSAAAPSPLTAATREPVPGRRASPRLPRRSQEGACYLEGGFGQRALRFESGCLGQPEPLNAEPAELAGGAGDGVGGVLWSEGPGLAL